MTPKTNLHTHTSFTDGADTAETMVRAALERGFFSLGFSDHMPDGWWRIPPETVAEYRAEALRLNRPPQRFDGLAGSAELPVRVEAEQVELAALKKAEKEDCAVVRLVERGGRHSAAVLHTACRLVETGLTEWEDGAELTPVDGRIVVTFRPFEIKTFKLKK